jgi:tape measure domain-containing protein
VTAPLSWNLHGNDQLSAVLERLDRTVSHLDHTMRTAAAGAREYGRAVGAAEAPGKRLQATTTETGRRFDFFKEKLIATAVWLRTIAVIAGVALFSVASAAGVMGLKLAAANETAAVSFEVMLGSAEKAGAFLKKLQDFAAATPFEMPQLRNAASRLLAVGVEANRVIPLMTVLGDVTSGMGTGAEGIERAITALSQMRQKTKVTAEEMMQLTEAGIPAWQSLAAELHTTVADAMKQVERRTVDADEMFQALEHHASPALQRLTGMMKRQSTTLTGLWSTFKDNAGQALATFMEPALPGLKKLMEFGSVAIPAILSGIQAGTKQIGSIFAGSDVPQKLIDSLKALGEKIIPKLKESWDKIVKTIADNKEGLEKFGRFIADVIIPIFGTSLSTSIDTVTAAFQGVIWVTAHVVDAIRFMTGAMLANLRFILDAAVLTFGWVPELGPKLKAAQREFDKFAENIMAKLDALDGRQADVWINVHERGSKGEHGGPGIDELFGLAAKSKHAAGGGDIPGWNLYGEQGPELHFQPGGGMTMTAAATRAAMRGSDVIGVLRVIHQTPDGHTIREELLALKRRSGKSVLGLA